MIVGIDLTWLMRLFHPFILEIGSCILHFSFKFESRHSRILLYWERASIIQLLLVSFLVAEPGVRSKRIQFGGLDNS